MHVASYLAAIPLGVDHVVAGAHQVRNIRVCRPLAIGIQRLDSADRSGQRRVPPRVSDRRHDALSQDLREGRVGVEGGDHQVDERVEVRLIGEAVLRLQRVEADRCCVRIAGADDVHGAQIGIGDLLAQGRQALLHPVGILPLGGFEDDPRDAESAEFSQQVTGGLALAGPGGTMHERVFAQARQRHAHRPDGSLGDIQHLAKLDLADPGRCHIEGIDASRLDPRNLSQRRSAYRRERVAARHERCGQPKRVLRCEGCRDRILQGARRAGRGKPVCRGPRSASH